MSTSFLAILVCLLVVPSTLADDFEDRLVKGPPLSKNPPRRVLRSGVKKGDALVIYGPGLDLTQPSPGDHIFLDVDLIEEVGVYVLLCSPTVPPLFAICSNTLSFYVEEDEEPEVLTFQGIANTAEEGAPLSAAITGGTGRFSGATGLVKGTNFDVVTFEIYFD